MTLLKIVIQILTGAAAGLLADTAACIIAGMCVSKRLTALDIQNTHHMSAALKKAERVFMVLLGVLVILTEERPGTVAFEFIILLCLNIQLITDYEIRVIPNGVILAMFAAKIAFTIPSAFGADGFSELSFAATADSVLGCIVLSLMFAFPNFRKGKENMGGGDIKLMGAIGFCFGLSFALVSVALCGILLLGFMAGKTYIEMMKPGKVKNTLQMAEQIMTKAVPLGVALGISTAVVMIINNIVHISFIDYSVLEKFICRVSLI